MGSRSAAPAEIRSVGQPMNHHQTEVAATTLNVRRCSPWVRSAGFVARTSLGNRCVRRLHRVRPVNAALRDRRSRLATKAVSVLTNTDPRCPHGERPRGTPRRRYSCHLRHPVSSRRALRRGRGESPASKAHSMVRRGGSGHIVRCVTTEGSDKKTSGGAVVAFYRGRGLLACGTDSHCGASVKGGGLLVADRNYHRTGHDAWRKRAHRPTRFLQPLDGC